MGLPDDAEGRKPAIKPKPQDTSSYRRPATLPDNLGGLKSSIKPKPQDTSSYRPPSRNNLCIFTRPSCYAGLKRRESGMSRKDRISAIVIAVTVIFLVGLLIAVNIRAPQARLEAGVTIEAQLADVEATVRAGQ